MSSKKTPPHIAENHRFVDQRQSQVERLALTERLMAGFAHQLRNPLAAISSLAENLAAEMETSDPRVEYTSRLLNQVEKMEQLIRSGLAFTPRSHGQRRICSAKDLAAAASHQFERRTGTRLRVDVDVEADEPLFVDPLQMTECLELLLDRACDVCAESESIVLQVVSESKGEHSLVCFSVQDTGPAIPAEDLPKILEPFFTTKARGLGLGLAMAQVLAVQNGGTMEVRSDAEGTRFDLWLEATSDGASG